MKPIHEDDLSENALIDEIGLRLEAFGIPADRVALDEHGRVSLDPGDMLHVLEIEAQTGFRSPFALGRALDERRRYKHLGILVIQLDLSSFCNPDNPTEIDEVLRHLSRNVRELDACYRCVDTTLVMLMPETGTRTALYALGRRVQNALAMHGIRAMIGAAATGYRAGARGHEYLGSALMALVEAQSSPDGIGFVEV